MEIDTDRKYGIDGQYVEFSPHLLYEGDFIECEGIILKWEGENNYRLVTDNPSHSFVPAHLLNKKWRIL